MPFRVTDRNAPALETETLPVGDERDDDFALNDTHDGRSDMEAVTPHSDTVAGVADITPRRVAGSPPSSQALFASGSFSDRPHVARYTILEQLGQGGMGVVYAAYDSKLDRKVAIKVLRTHSLGNDEARARLAREAQAMAKLSHPNVVQIYDVGETDDQIFVAMEFIKGSTLRQWSRGHTGRWREVLTMYLQAARGLMAAHRAGIIHRDFKPDNVLVGEGDRVCVADFGLACAAEMDALAPMSGTAGTAGTAENESPRAPRERNSRHLDTPLTATGALMGTPAYMSPEQFSGASTDEKTDQFSLCAALFEGLYGVRPFAGKTMTEQSSMVCSGDMVSLPEGSAVPRWLSNAVLRGLATDPADRWRTIDDLIAALEDDPARRWRKRRNIAALAIAILAVIGLGGLAKRATDNADRERVAKAEARSERDQAFERVREEAKVQAKVQARPPGADTSNP